MTAVFEYFMERFGNRRFRQILIGFAVGIFLCMLYWASNHVPRANLIPFAIAAVTGLVLLFQYPIIGLCLLAFIHASNIMTILPTGFLLPLTVGTFGIVLLKKLTVSDMNVRLTPFVGMAIVLFAWFMASAIWAPSYDQFEVMIFIRLLAMILAVAFVMENPNHLIAVILALGIGLIVSTVVTVEHMLSFFSTGTLVQSGVEHGLDKARFFGYWSDPNACGMSAAPILVINYALFRCKLPVAVRLVSLLSVFAGLVSVALSQSRSAGVMVAIALIIFIWSDKRRWILLGFTVVSAFAVLFVVKVDFLARMATLLQGTRDTSVAARSAMLTGTIDMFSDYFPLGVGWGNVQTFSADYTLHLKKGLVSHNGFLDVFAEGGFIALFFYLMLLLSVVPSLRIHRLRIIPENLEQTLGIGMIAVFCTLLIAILVGSYSFYQLYWFLFAVITSRAWVFCDNDRMAAQDLK
jgi:O-antigen ligase